MKWLKRISVDDADALLEAVAELADQLREEPATESGNEELVDRLIELGRTAHWPNTRKSAYECLCRLGTPRALAALAESLGNLPEMEACVLVEKLTSDAAVRGRSETLFRASAADGRRLVKNAGKAGLKSLGVAATSAAEKKGRAHLHGEVAKLLDWTGTWPKPKAKDLARLREVPDERLAVASFLGHPGARRVLDEEPFEPPSFESPSDDAREWFSALAELDEEACVRAHVVFECIYDDIESDRVPAELSPNPSIMAYLLDPTDAHRKAARGAFGWHPIDGAASTLADEVAQWIDHVFEDKGPRESKALEKILGPKAFAVVREEDVEHAVVERIALALLAGAVARALVPWALDEGDPLRDAYEARRGKKKGPKS